MIPSDGAFRPGFYEYIRVLHSPAAQVKEDELSNCTWEVVKIINIPRRARFLDYSGVRGVTIQV